MEKPHHRCENVSLTVAPTQTHARTQGASVQTHCAFATPAAAGPDLHAEWGELADRAAATPFNHPGWIATWADAFADQPLSLYGIRREGRLVGIAPFLERRRIVVSPTNWHTPRFELVAADESARHELARGLLERGRHRVDLSFLDEGSGDIGALRAAATEDRRLLIDRPIQRSLYVDLDGDWEDYTSELGGKVLREVRRRRRRLEAEGAVEVAFVTPDEGVEALLEEGFSVEGSGWKHERGTAIASRPETRSFYTGVARWAAERGWLLLAFLRVDGRVAAFDLCIEQGGRTYVLKGGYDPAFRQFAPRTLLLHDSLQRAFARGGRSYEFLGADEDYKRRWATGVRERRRLQAFGRTPAGRGGYTLWTVGRRAGKRAVAIRDKLAR